MIYGDYVNNLRNDGRQVEQLAKCEEFQAYAYNTLKNSL